MESWILEMIADYGYIGVFLIIVLENLFPPIPSEIVLSFSGFMTTRTELTVWGVILSSTMGSVVGAIILFRIGLVLDVSKLEKFIDRWGHILRLTKGDVRNADGWFVKYDVWTVFFCRMIPLLRSMISLPAGMSKMNFTLFVFLTFIGTLIWNTILVCVGAMLGESWQEIITIMELYSKVIYVVLALAAIWFIYFYFKVLRNRKI
jgi:membrane protein DedA with SNARE-associated domain